MFTIILTKVRLWNVLFKVVRWFSCLLKSNSNIYQGQSALQTKRERIIHKCNPFQSSEPISLNTCNYINQTVSNYKHMETACTCLQLQGHIPDRSCPLHGSPPPEGHPDVPDSTQSVSQNTMINTMINICKNGYR